MSGVCLCSIIQFGRLACQIWRPQCGKVVAPLLAVAVRGIEATCKIICTQGFLTVYSGALKEESSNSRMLRRIVNVAIALAFGTHSKQPTMHTASNAN